MSTGPKRVNSRSKGKRIELSARDFLRGLGFECDRAARNGVKDGADLCHNLERVHIEVKGGKMNRARLDAAFHQAHACRGSREQWCVLWREDRKDWKLTFRADSPSVRVTVEDGNCIATVLLWLNRVSEGATVSTIPTFGAKP